LQEEKKGTSTSKHPFVGLKKEERRHELVKRIASAVSIRSKNINKAEYFSKTNVA